MSAASTVKVVVEGKGLARSVEHVTLDLQGLEFKTHDVCKAYLIFKNKWKTKPGQILRSSVPPASSGTLSSA